jgi:hypothetical protein
MVHTLATPTKDHEKIISNGSSNKQKSINTHHFRDIKLGPYVEVISDLESIGNLYFLTIDLDIAEKPLKFLIDGGAEFSIVNADHLQQEIILRNDLRTEAIYANNTKTTSLGLVFSRFQIKDKRNNFWYNFEFHFQAIKNFKYDGILGTDFLKRYSVTQSFKNATIQLVLPEYNEIYSPENNIIKDFEKILKEKDELITNLRSNLTFLKAKNEGSKNKNDLISESKLETENEVKNQQKIDIKQENQQECHETKNQFKTDSIKDKTTNENKIEQTCKSKSRNLNQKITDQKHDKNLNKSNLFKKSQKNFFENLHNNTFIDQKENYIKKVNIIKEIFPKEESKLEKIKLTLQDKRPDSQIIPPASHSIFNIRQNDAMEDIIYLNKEILPGVFASSTLCRPSSEGMSILIINKNPIPVKLNEVDLNLRL